MPQDITDILQYDDEALDLVSARFADLVAQEYQQRLLDQIARQLFQAETEEDFAQFLLRAVAQRCGEHSLLYVGLDEPSLAPLLVTHGYGQRPEVSPTPARSLLAAGSGYVIEGKAVSLALGTQFPVAAGLRLRNLNAPTAVITLDRQPEETIVLDFLERLGERASQALSSLRMREGLEQTRRALHRQRQQVQRQTRLLNLMDDWSQVLSRLEDRYAQLEKLLATAVNTLGGEKGSLMLLDESSGELVVRATFGLEPEVQERIRRGDQTCRRLKLGEGVAGKVCQSLQPMIVNQVDREPVFLEPELSQVASIVCLPLHVDGLALGVMNVTNRARGRQFQAEHIEEGMKLALQAAQAINNSRLYHLAILDPVTEVYSRNHLFQRCQDELTRARRYQRPLCLLAINLQGLEQVRNHHGHELGNQLEILFADVLQFCVRETDIVARLGDSNFGVLMPETDAMAGMFAAERICQQSRESELLTRYYVTAHVGLCSYPDRAENVMKLIARAETAMASAARCSDSLPVVLAPGVGVEMEAPPVAPWAPGRAAV
ncbi:MAG: diguanylate cyclase [Candidatus Eremiobacteraeota bacterium]|nr:diguanylate cyclase [Candidatus Eremiobacteraeota bacterium]